MFANSCVNLQTGHNLAKKWEMLEILVFLFILFGMKQF